MFMPTRAEKTFQWFNNLGVGLLSFIFLYPFWYILVLSLNDGGDALKGGIFWWPRAFTLDNYKILFMTNEIVKAYAVTLIRTVLGTVSSLFFMAMVAFGLSRPELPGRKFINFVFIVTMFFSGGLIPFYLLLHDINLLNNFLVYILPGLFSTFYMIIMRTSFRDIHEGLIESAQMDGAGYFQILLRIVIPISVPMLAAIALFTAVGHWNDWFTGAYFINSANMQPVQTYLKRLMDSATLLTTLQGTSGTGALNSGMLTSTITPVSMRMAILIVVIAPIIAIYPFVQRFFIKGVLIGSIKE